MATVTGGRNTTLSGNIMPVFSQYRCTNGDYISDQVVDAKHLLYQGMETRSMLLLLFYRARFECRRAVAA